MGHQKSDKIPKMAENFYFNRDFEAFEEFAENLRLWNIQIRKLQCGKSTNTLKQLQLGEMQLAYGFVPDKTHQIGGTPPGRTIAFHAGRNSKLVWRKKEVPHNGLMIFPNNSELDAVTKGTHNHLYTITIPEDVLASRGEVEEQEKYRTLVTTQELIFIPKNHINRLKTLFQICFQAIDNKPELIASRIFEEKMQIEFLDALTQAIIPTMRTTANSTRATKYQTWQKIEEVIKFTLNAPLTVSELSRTVGVSERTLLRLFQERFGISPKAYLCKIRLNGVRHNLTISSPGEVKIVDIANAWGFWHMGQFASDYKQLFGELPSATLNKIRSTFDKEQNLRS